MFEERTSHIRALLSESGLAAYAANGPANVAYLTGFEGVFDEEPASVALVTPDSLALYTDGRYVEVVSAAAEGHAVGGATGHWRAVAFGEPSMSASRSRRATSASRRACRSARTAGSRRSCSAASRPSRRGSSRPAG